MKALLMLSLLIPQMAMRAQTINLKELQPRCLPNAPLSTLGAIIHVESGGNPNAIQIDFPKALLIRWRLPKGTLRLQRQPITRHEALDWLAYFQRYDVFVDLGLMQVSSAEAKRRGIPPASLLEPCTNLRVGLQILEDDYRIEVEKYGPGQSALHHALSRYNTGDTHLGITNGYVDRFLTAVRSQALINEMTAKKSKLETCKHRGNR